MRASAGSTARPGKTFAHLHVPTSCRHCEHPHCMADCPPNAIHRGPDGEVFIDDTCIGCGNCQRNCPYGVIRMDKVPPKKPNLLAWLLGGLGPGPGEPPKKWTEARVSPETPKKAIKCDMCSGIEGGPACVRACPTGRRDPGRARGVPDRRADGKREAERRVATQGDRRTRPRRRRQPRGLPAPPPLSAGSRSPRALSVAGDRSAIC